MIDGSRHGTTGTGVTGSHSTGTRDTHGTHGTTGAGYGSTIAGPHSSNIANKADPRVDSDLGRLFISSSQKFSIRLTNFRWAWYSWNNR